MLTEPVKELDSSEETITPEQVIKTIKEHPFEFGFRYPLENNLASFQWYKDKLYLIYTPSKTSDPIWYGNCVDDACLTYEESKNKLPPDARISIWRRKAKNFSPVFKILQHFSTYIELPSSNGRNSILEDIDHSKFYTSILTTNNETIKSREIEEEELLLSIERKDKVSKNTKNYFEISEHILQSGETVLLFGKIENHKGKIIIKIRIYKGNEDLKEITISDNVQTLNRGQLYSRTYQNPTLLPNTEESFAKQGLDYESLNIVRDSLLLIAGKIPPKKSS